MANIRKHLQVINELRKLNRFDYLKEAPEKTPSVSGIERYTSSSGARLNTQPSFQTELKLPPTENNNLFYAKQPSGVYKLVVRDFTNAGIPGFYAKEKYPYTYLTYECLPPGLDVFQNPDPSWTASRAATPPCFAVDKKKAADDQIKKLQQEKELVCKEFIYKLVGNYNPMTGAKPQQIQEKNPKYDPSRCLVLTNLLAPKSETSIHSPGWQPQINVYNQYTPENLMNPTKQVDKPWYEDVYDWFVEHPFLTELAVSLIVGIATGGASLLVQAVAQAGVSLAFALPKAINGDWTGFALAIAIGSIPVVTRSLKLGVKGPMNFLKKYQQTLQSFTTKQQVVNWAKEIMEKDVESRLLLKAVRQTPGEFKKTLNVGLGRAFINAVDKEKIIDLGKLTLREKAWWRVLLIDFGLQGTVAVGGTIGIFLSQYDPKTDRKLAQEHADQIAKSSAKPVFTPEQQKTVDQERKIAREKGDFVVKRSTSDPKKNEELKKKMDETEWYKVNELIKLENEYNPASDTIWTNKSIAPSGGYKNPFGENPPN